MYLKIKSFLPLLTDAQTTNFLVFMFLSFLIQGMSDVKSSPLSSIDENLINACSFLEDFREERKLDCLQTFVSCADIIEWIRTYTKGNASV